MNGLLALHSRSRINKSQPFLGGRVNTNHDSKPVDPKIINISSYNLTQAEINILKRGLKFTPTPNENVSELKVDTMSFTRKLRLKEYFHDKNIHDMSLEKTKEFSRPKEVGTHILIV